MIKLRANIFIGLLIMLLSMLTLAADKAAGAAEVEKLNEQVRVLDKELAVLKEVSAKQLDAQDKRIADLSLSASHQSNHIAMVANQTASLGNYIGLVSLLIAVIAAVAGIFVYRQVPQKAADEAKQWFKDNSKQVMEDLKNQATLAEEKMQAHTDAVANARQQLETAIKKAEFDILNVNNHRGDDLKTATADAESIKIVAEASKALESKPEVKFTAKDHFLRGLAHLGSKNFQSAIVSFDNAIASNPNDEELIKALNGKAVALGVFGQYVEAIAVFEQIDLRFGQSKLPAMREQVAKALVNKGFRFGGMKRFHEEIAVYEQIEQRFGNDELPAMREPVLRALFNKGVTLDEMGKFEEAIAVYEQINQRFGKYHEPVLLEQVASALFNKGFRLDSLGKFDEAFATYEQIVERFGKYNTPAIKERVARALNGGAFLQIMLSKQQWTNLENRVSNLNEALVKLERSLRICKAEDTAMVQGNVGYCHFLLGNKELAETHTLICLKLGDEESLKAQHADTKLHRIEPQDTEYEALLEACWQKLHPKT